MNNNIQEDYCSFEVSKLLKEKRFGVACNGKYQYTKGWEYTDTVECINYNASWFEGDVSCPTHALAIKWIRENFGYHIYTYTNGKIWYPCIQHLFGDIAVLSGKIGIYNTSEEAIEAALLYTLQNLI